MRRRPTKAWLPGQPHQPRHWHSIKHTVPGLQGHKTCHSSHTFSHVGTCPSACLHTTTPTSHTGRWDACSSRRGGRVGCDIICNGSLILGSAFRKAHVYSYCPTTTIQFVLPVPLPTPAVPPSTFSSCTIAHLHFPCVLPLHTWLHLACLAMHTAFMTCVLGIQTVAVGLLHANSPRVGGLLWTYGTAPSGAWWTFLWDCLKLLPSSHLGQDRSPLLASACPLPLPPLSWAFMRAEAGCGQPGGGGKGLIQCPRLHPLRKTYSTCQALYYYIHPPMWLEGVVV